MPLPLLLPYEPSLFLLLLLLLLVLQKRIELVLSVLTDGIGVAKQAGRAAPPIFKNILIQLIIFMGNCVRLCSLSPFDVPLALQALLREADVFQKHLLKENKMLHERSFPQKTF